MLHVDGKKGKRENQAVADAVDIARVKWDMITVQICQVFASEEGEDVIPALEQKGCVIAEHRISPYNLPLL